LKLPASGNIKEFTTMQFKLYNLELVYPPISNQVASWLWEDHEVRSDISQSMLYMIGQRREILYDNFDLDNDAGTLRFDLVSGLQRIPGIVLPLRENGIPEEVGFELGDKLIRVWSDKVNMNLLNWWTVDALLFDFWRGSLVASGLDDFRLFTSFNLHYVGISTKQDSFSRLFEKGHKNRAKILSDESQYNPDSRLTDELVIFLFDLISPIQINVLTGTSDEEFDRFLNPTNVPKSRTIADAEKAFIKIMETQYNQIKYAKYPVIADGLHGTDLSRWSFMVNEPITLITDNASMKFSRIADDYSRFDDSDFIFVNGTEVILVNGKNKNS